MLTAKILNENTWKQFQKRKSKSVMKSFLWKHLRIHIKIDEPYRKKAFQSSNKSEAPNQKMRIVALIFVLFLLRTFLEGQEAEEDLATIIYLKIAIAFELYILLLLKSGLIILLLHTMHCCFWWCCCWINQSLRIWEILAHHIDDIEPIESFCIIQESRFELIIDVFLKIMYLCQL